MQMETPGAREVAAVYDLCYVQARGGHDPIQQHRPPSTGMSGQARREAAADPPPMT